MQGYHIAFSARLCPFSVKLKFFTLINAKFHFAGLLECIFSMAMPFLAYINLSFSSMQSFTLQGYYITPRIKTQHTFAVKIKIRAPRRKQSAKRSDYTQYGALGGIRTHDLPVRSRALYPLSYKRIFLNACIF